MKAKPSSPLFFALFASFEHAFARSLLDRGATAIGLLCLIATVWLLPVGVRTVQAGDGPGAEALAGMQEASPAPGVSIDPPLVEAAEQAQKSDVAGHEAGAREVRPLPGYTAAPGEELAPGEIVLNPRGYNYDADITDLGPAALNLERLLNR